MYDSVISGSPAVERVWMGDSVVEPGVGHRSDPVLGADLVFTIIDEACQTALQGPVTERTVYPHKADAHYIGVRLRPGVGVPCNDASMTELRDGSVAVASIGGVDLSRLAEHLVGLGDLGARAAAVGRTMDRTAVSRQPRSALVVAALERFKGDSARARVDAVARDLGVTERSLQRHFSRHLGINPKHAARLVRIERLQKQIDQSRAGEDLASLALAAGFFDQSHMANEVSRVLGITPQQLVDERRADAGRHHR